MGSVTSQTSVVGLSTATLMIMKLVKQIVQAAIQVTHIIFQKMLLTFPPKVVEQITKNSTIVSNTAITGEINQEATVHSNLVQLISDADTPARPAPISAPITVCVPLIGMPKIDDTKMNENEAKLVPSIIRS